MPPWQAVIDAALRELTAAGIDATGWALGAARATPSVLLIPAFGLRALPVPSRILIALALMASSAPTLGTLPAGEPWILALPRELLRGLPVAVGAATTLWTASMAGNLLDTLLARPPATVDLAGTDGQSSHFGALLSLGASISFFALGGPARLAAALAEQQPAFEQTLRSVALGLARGIGVAILLGAPLIVLSAFFDLFHAIVTRASRGLPMSSIVVPGRTLVLLASLALLLERVFAGLAAWMDGRLPSP